MSFKRKSLWAPLPSTTRGQAVQLSADPKNEKILYTNGRTVFIRDLANPALATEYTEHTCATTVARWAPSGYYIASGDVQGNVRIWDATQETQMLKLQTRPISSRINDIAWDSESKRLIAVGDGKERYGHAFSFDTGNSVGEISGHSKVINACSIRQQRPFRAATCSDDMTVNFYHGPPFKFQKSLTLHSRFVQSVKFSPDGQLLVSVGADGKIFLYDGSTGDKVAELAEGGHAGGIFAVSWSPDSKQLMTSSADRTVKLWDVESRRSVHSIKFSDKVEDQQVGNLWAGSHLLSLSLGGDLNYLDARTEKPVRHIYGHQKAITAFQARASTSEESSRVFSGSYDGRVFTWSDETATPITGVGHSNQVSDFALTSSRLYTVGMDDQLRAVDISSNTFDVAVAVPTEAVPKAVIAREDGLVVVATLKALKVVKKGTVLQTIPLNDTPLALALSPDGKEVALGGEDMKVHLFTLVADKLEKQSTVLTQNRGQTSSLAYSPDGRYLAVGDSDRKVLVYARSNWEVALNQWVFHTARVTCVAWSKDSKHAVSGGLDRDVYVWSVDQPMKSISIKGAHQDGVTGVQFLDEHTVASCGQDASVKLWTVTYH